MTKKFWDDWQQRVEETKSIDLKHRGSLILKEGDRLKTINFDNEKDEVELIIEHIYGGNFIDKKYIENGLLPIKADLYYKFERDDILTIQFKKPIKL